MEQNVCFRVPVFSPGAPTSDADTLDNVDAKLTDVHKEESKKPERAVTPAESEKKKTGKIILIQILYLSKCSDTTV